MSRPSREILALGAGALLAVFGIVQMTSVPSNEPVSSTLTIPAATTATLDQAPDHPAPVQGDLAGLPGSVGRILSEQGAAERMSDAELSAQLPRSVVEVLIANDAVLAIPAVDPAAAP